MNNWQRIGRFLLTPAGVGIVVLMALVFVPGLWEGFLGRIDRVLETAHVHFMTWANRHGGDFVTGFLLLVGGLWLWRKGSAKGGGGKK